MRADEQLSGYLLVCQSLGDEAARGQLGVGETLPARRGPSLGSPVPVPYPQLAQSPARARYVSACPQPRVLTQRLVKRPGGFVPLARPGEQDTLVLGRA